MNLSGYLLLLYVLSWSGFAAAQQPASLKCTSAVPAMVAQTVQCEGGITIVAENGAQYTLSDNNRDGRVDAVELSSKALLVEATRRSGGKRFQVNTPQAIAAVRGTRWAVDVAEGKTSVFVVNGSVRVGGRARDGRGRVVLGPGEGVDVEATAPLLVKRWGQARVSALMARLGQ
ncbi:MAG: FecR domain-containing protein [Bradyrhizobium sp.]|uniref:FecR domain-containing protein n=1 Tax=Bradyrhizobium sp. TaxID=376 RepID=UPI0025C2F159|nr:FecR domain-containing protein [Bradyrhizobium sp.]MBI5263638.1 FecR domain-containing protein [Bradyrhizobium sp.]